MNRYTSLVKNQTSPTPSPVPAATPDPAGFEGLAQVMRMAAPRQLYKSVEDLGTLLTSKALRKAMGEESPSAVGQEPGEQQWPFDFHVASRFKIFNVHHSTCIRAKTKALVGLGHVLAEDLEAPEPTKFDANGVPMPKPKKTRKSPSKVALALDPLCEHSWQHTLTQLAEDYWQLGNAYLEVVRSGDQITGLHWLPAVEVMIVVEDNLATRIHYVVKGRIGGDVAMARFGDLKAFNSSERIVLGSKSQRSEVIHIPQPTTLDRFYGVPQWLASAPLVELVQALHQHQFDFHNNRGVPEFLMVLLGAKADKKTWGKVVETFNGWVGLGNQHKASVFNFPDPNMKVELHKLAIEGIQNGTFFRDMSETLSTTIVSAHGVPPSLAGILIPGKMGASNEASNALLIFQTLEMGPEQTHFETMLGSRLGDPRRGGGLGLAREDFELRTIIEEMAEATDMLKPVDTIGKMKQQLPQAAAEGRNLDSGVKKSVTLRLAEALEDAAERLGG